MNGNTTVESLDPTGRPMEQPTQVVEPPKQKKTGLIIAIIVGLVVLIGGVTAAVVIAMNMKKDDAVLAAMQKIMSGEAPKNVAIDGDINLLSNNPDSPIKRINIDLDSDTVVGSMINTSSAVVTLTDQSDKDYSARVDEIYAAHGDVFFKVEGVTALLEDSNLLNVMMGDTTGSDDATTMNNQIMNTIVGVIEAADGVWLRVSLDDLQMTNSSGLLGSSNISCITDLVSDVNKNSNSAAEMYNKYPFITSTDKDIIVTAKQNPIYQISVDSKNFTNYVNAMQNTELAKSLYSCMGWNDNADVTEEDVEKVINAMPKVYAEVDHENNFTRLYLESDLNNGAANATIDLGISYPTNVNVTEPVEYTNYADFIQTLFTSMYNLQTE